MPDKERDELVREINDAKESLAERVEVIGEKVNEKVNVGARARVAADRARGAVRANPARYALLAGAAGIVVGRAFGR